MAQTDTYANLLLLIEAYMGATLIDIEKTRIKALINSRAHAAYRESNFWESYLVTEPMTVDTRSNAIPYVGAVSDTTSNNANTGDVDTYLRVHKDDPYGGTQSQTEYEFFAKDDGAQLVGYKENLAQASEFESGLSVRVSGGDLQITVASNQMDLYLANSIELSGFATTTIDVNLTFQISTVSYSGGDTSTTSLGTGLADHTFALTGDEAIKIPTAYVTYKRRLDVTFGTDAGETSAIPLEFFEYMALGVYSDTLAQDGFHEKAMVWEGKANQALQRELMRIDRNRAHQFVGHRIRTHSSSQARQASSI